MLKILSKIKLKSTLNCANNFQSLPIIFLLLFYSFEVQAFKIDTHLWIGQQVINDLEDDGSISIRLDSRLISIPVSKNIRDAILNHKNEFLMGNIGPDALPDVVVGQMLVHPGIRTEDGWKTNDWLKFLLKKSENNSMGRAFAYGYLGHAAADVFAHTYVNQYAGDIFLLSDNETLVEQRHVALESFISKHNPRFEDVKGHDLEDPWMLIKPSDDLANFIRDTLIYDDEAQNQYQKSSASKHLVAYRNYRNAISKAAESGIWLEIDKAVLQAVVSYYGYENSAQEAEALINFMNNEVIPKVQQHINLTQEEINRLNNAIDRYDAMHHDAITNSLRQIISLNSKILSLVAERAAADQQVCQNIVENICREPPKPPGCGRRWWQPRCPPPICNLINKTVCAVPEASVNLIRQIDSQLNGENGLHNQLLQTVDKLHDQLVVAKNSSLDIAHRIVDLGQVLTSNTSPAKSLLQNWTADLDLAMASYIKAASNTMINTMVPNQQLEETIKPMIDWWDCYHLSLVGVPSAVGSGACGFRGSIENVWASLENIQMLIEDAAAFAPAKMTGLPSPSQIRAEINKLKQDAIDQIKQAAISELVDILPAEVQDFIGVLGEDMTDDRLRYYFTKPEKSKNKGLLMIADIDQRIKTEMFLPPDSKFDPEQYAVVYDAVVLAKLSILDNHGLHILAQEAGIPYKTDGTDLFANTPNILADAIASLDGNHQWLSIAPPRPSIFSPYVHPNLPGYPFSSGYSSAAGFIPWQAEVRDALFRSLFIGPLSPGIEMAREIGFPELLPADYPYRSCLASPFPDDEFDTTCATVYSSNPGSAPTPPDNGHIRAPSPNPIYETQPVADIPETPCTGSIRLMQDIYLSEGLESCI